MKNENEVGYVKQLHSGECLDCDDCGKIATVRITQKSGTGIAYGFYCKRCVPEIPSLPSKAS